MLRQRQTNVPGPHPRSTIRAWGIHQNRKNSRQWVQTDNQTISVAWSSILPCQVVQILACTHCQWAGLDEKFDWPTYCAIKNRDSLTTQHSLVHVKVRCSNCPFSNGTNFPGITQKWLPCAAFDSFGGWGAHCHGFAPLFLLLWRLLLEGTALLGGTTKQKNGHEVTALSAPSSRRTISNSRQPCQSFTHSSSPSQNHQT